jgi:hypothetical protein
LENAIEILQDVLGLIAPTIEYLRAPAAIKHRGSGLPIGESIETWAAELETPLRELLADLRQVLP